MSIIAKSVRRKSLTAVLPVVAIIVSMVSAKTTKAWDQTPFKPHAHQCSITCGPVRWASAVFHRPSDTSEPNSQ